jgi:hypothetical protein
LYVKANGQELTSRMSWMRSLEFLLLVNWRVRLGGRGGAEAALSAMIS